MQNNQNSSLDAVTADLVEQLKPAITAAVSEALADLQSKPLTAIEAAEFLSMPIGTLYQWTTAKRIPYYKLGRSLRFFPEELRNWIKSGAPSY